MSTFSQLIWRLVLPFLLGGTTQGLYSANQYAENFSLQYFSTHKLLTVTNPWRGSGDLSYQYALVPKGGEVPDLPDGVQIIRTPTERIIITATVYLGPIRTLDLYDQLVGIAYLDFTSDPEVHARVDNGTLKPIQGGAALEIESILQLQPDLILTSTTGESLYDDHPKLERAKLPAVLTAGYMESHPLARSEWIKVIAALVDKEEEAEAFFNQVAQEYEALTAMTRSVKNRPTVFSNAPYAGVWHVPGGSSYNARAFADAGANYLWAENRSSGGVPLDFEVILHEAAVADVWLNPGAYRTRASLLALDSRFTGFRAFREGKVFNNSLRANEHGGNDIWERGINHPEEVLADLIKVFHPDLFPDHQFIYYEQLK
ncbi:ABC transporter substrate-binding protein [Opitutia bacterium ISCC 51]|nr:ABC transporter substrate-binding protein [Opitutae bacterium ISCC 51]QXD27966.1 ABC transporter substrate-binding protein [Opitutae bacterium ISCC 52]